MLVHLHSYPSNNIFSHHDNWVPVGFRRFLWVPVVSRGHRDEYDDHDDHDDDHDDDHNDDHDDHHHNYVDDHRNYVDHHDDEDDETLC